MLCECWEHLACLQSAIKADVRMKMNRFTIIWIASCVALLRSILGDNQINDTMLPYMDLAVDPCDNFYKFACGGYQKEKEIPETRPWISPLSEMSIRMLENLKEILEDDTANEIDWSTPSASMVRTYYASCKDVETLDHIGLEPFRLLLDQFLGWPVLYGSDWDQAESRYDWIHHNAILSARLGVSHILELSIGSDLKYGSKKTIHIDQDSLFLGKRDYYVNESHSKFLDTYLTYMVKSVMLYGVSEETARKEMKEVLDFEIELAKISTKEEERRDISVLYNPMRLSDLQNVTSLPLIDWFQIISDETGLNLSDSDEINLSAKPYLEQLPGVLEKTPKRTQANYQLWRLASHFNRYLPPNMREHAREFNEALYGVPKQKPRWEECLVDVIDQMPLLLGAIYVKKHFSEEAKNEVDTMTTTVREAMSSTLDQAEWMDTETKDLARKKLTNMIHAMAYPAKQIHNETWLLISYKHAHLRKDEYMNNVISIWKSAARRSFDEYRKPIDRNEWREGIAAVNAWYAPTLNKMIFPAGILSHPMYAPTSPYYMNYGRIGSVIGHELTHGFDDTGRQFDADGNFNLWWSNATLEKFKSGAKCMIDQYGAIKDESSGGMQLNGAHTQGENIADNGGVRLSFMAFKQRMASTGNKYDPPEMLKNYTAEQLFFVSYGQVWCMKIRPEALRRQIITDSHAPSEYRVNVVLQNMDDFSTAFNCPSTSKMNPSEKCKVW